MSWRKITYPCIDCGAVVTRFRRQGQVLACFECAKKRVQSYNDRQHAERLARTDVKGLRGRSISSE